MPCCVLIHCKNSQKEKNESELSYHRFPSNPHLRNEWISIIRKSRKDDNWVPGKSCMLCSLHFKKEEIRRNEGGHKCLRRNTLPTLCLSASRTASNAAESSLSCPVEIVTVPEFDPPPDSPEEVKNEIVFLPETTNEELEKLEELDEMEDDSDIEEALDSPLNFSLRLQLRKKKALTANHRQKIKVLVEQVKILEARNQSVKQELKQLTKKKIGQLQKKKK